MILKGKFSNIRKAIKDGRESAEVCKAKIEQMLHTVIALYTSANFDRQDSRTTDILISESANFIIKHYALFSVEEIKQAFELSAAGKIDADLSAYHGKFTIQMLGDILRKYWSFRMNIIARYDSKLTIMRNQQRKKDADEKNERTKQEVIDLFKKLKDDYQQTGEFDETQVKSFHGKIVSDAGLITFSQQEKLQIYAEAKDNVLKQIKTDVQDISLKPTERRSLKSMLSDVMQGRQSDDFKSRINAEYSVLLIIKEIIK